METAYLLGPFVAFAIGFYVGRPAARRVLKEQDFIMKLSRVVLCVCTGTAALVFFQLNTILVQSSSALLTYPRFDAEITAARSEIHEENKITEDGRRFTETRTFYRPTFSFTDAAGDDVTVEVATGSSDRPEIGAVRRIAYKEGHAIIIDA